MAPVLLWDDLSLADVLVAVGASVVVGTTVVGVTVASAKCVVVCWSDTGVGVTVTIATFEMIRQGHRHQGKNRPVGSKHT